MTYAQWEAAVPEMVRGDSLWRVQAYRLGLFLSDLCWEDATKLMKDRRTLRISDQLYRAVGKISSNVAEGYSRHSGRDRALFYDYAHGSARESRDWYYKARRILGAKVMEHRAELCTQITKLLIKMAATDRKTNRKLSDLSSSGIRNKASPIDIA